MKKSLVIGGSGFLGSHLVDLLIKKGHSVTNLDIIKPKWNIDGQKFFKSNILNEKKLDIAIKKKDYVFLFAGLSDLDEALRKQNLYFESNKGKSFRVRLYKAAVNYTLWCKGKILEEKDLLMLMKL